MSAEFYQTLWLILIVVLWAGFFFLEGFDYGVGILLPFLGKNDTERRSIINCIGPHWDGNEVWLLTAGGATFAAFPHWYATLFSGFYIPLFLLLIGLIVRGVAFEFRSKDNHPRWRAFWDWCIFSGSVLPAFLFGVAFANMAVGVPIDANKIYSGNITTLINPFGIFSGLSLVALFLFHGINFLKMKLSGDLLERTRRHSEKLWVLSFVFLAGQMIADVLITDGYAQRGWVVIILPLISFVSLFASGITLNKKLEGWTFALTGLSVLLMPITYFFNMFPRVMVSSSDPKFSLTIFNASSSAYTLTVLSIVALIFLPLVLGYQIWSYWVFRKRLVSDKLTY
jgi:cytochrome d ubiquinol oxidase subunit II